MRQCDTLIHAGLILTQDDRRSVVEKGSIAISAGRICAVDATESIQKQWQAEHVLEMRDCLLMPGMINAHTHAAMTFLRGFADDMPLIDWLRDRVFPAEARLTPRIVRLGSLLGYAEMLACGLTGCIDMYIFEEEVLKAAKTAGIRCMGGEAIFNFPSAACGSYKEALERTAELAAACKGEDRIKVAVNPHSVYTTNAKILEECRDLALALNLPLHIHLAESATETAASLDAHGVRPVEWCVKNGLFDCRAIAAHVVDVNEDELEVLAEKKVGIVHNPSSNMKLASGVAPIVKMLEKGLTVALGTDGPASNNRLNIFTEMRQAALLQKLILRDPQALPAQAALDMATRNGAVALGEMETGQLVTGMKADCIALDMKLPNMQPVLNPLSQVVYAADGHECRLTMVEGEILYMDGKFSRFDYEELLEECQELRDFACKTAQN